MKIRINIFNPRFYAAIACLFYSISGIALDQEEMAAENPSRLIWTNYYGLGTRVTTGYSVLMEKIKPDSDANKAQVAELYRGSARVWLRHGVYAQYAKNAESAIRLYSEIPNSFDKCKEISQRYDNTVANKLAGLTDKERYYLRSYIASSSIECALKNNSISAAEEAGNQLLKNIGMFNYAGYNVDFLWAAARKIIQSSGSDVGYQLFATYLRNTVASTYAIEDWQKNLRLEKWNVTKADISSIDVTVKALSSPELTKDVETTIFLARAKGKTECAQVKDSENKLQTAGLQHLAEIRHAQYRYCLKPTMFSIGWTYDEEIITFPERRPLRIQNGEVSASDKDGSISSELLD